MFAVSRRCGRRGFKARRGGTDGNVVCGPVCLATVPMGTCWTRTAVRSVAASPATVNPTCRVIRTAQTAYGCLTCGYCPMATCGREWLSDPARATRPRSGEEVRVVSLRYVNDAAAVDLYLPPDRACRASSSMPPVRTTPLPLARAWLWNGHSPCPTQAATRRSIASVPVIARKPARLRHSLGQSNPSVRAAIGAGCR